MPRILLIDDDEPLRKELSELLKRFEYEVREAEHGGSALSQLREHLFDLVITELVLPDIEGIEIISTLRKKHPSTKIIAVTGGDRASVDNYLKMARLLGANKVLAKPFQSADLLAAVRELV